ncbi:MAG: Ig-like domain-containing protein, partial [Thermoanaerobaculia bacterium]
MRTSLFYLLLGALFFVPRIALAQSEVAYTEDFQSYGSPRNPAGWLDNAIGSPAPLATGLYKTWPDPTQGSRGSNIVYGTRQSSGQPDGNTPRIGTFSTYTTQSFSGQGRFEYRGRFIRTTPDTHLGLTFFASLPETDRYYMVALWNGTMQLYAQGAGTPSGTLNSNFTPEALQWHRFLIQVDDSANVTHIRARFWLDGAPEPTTWQIDAVDNNASRLTSGRIGMWSAVRGDAYIDDLSAKSPVDHTAPSITLWESGVQLDPAVTKAIGHEALVEAKVTDDLSGTAQTKLTVDGQPYTPLSPYATEGTHTFRAEATDYVGNSASVEAKLLIDLTPPVIKLTVDDQPITNPKYKTPIAIDIEATDAWTGATFIATLDGQPYASGTTVSANGTHHLFVEATDGVGHKSTALLTFLVDQLAPVITFKESGSVVSGSVAFKYNPKIEILVEDPHSTPTVTSTLNGQPYVSLTPITVDGRYVVHVEAVDEAGNQAQADLNVLVDKVPPLVVLKEGSTVLDPVQLAKYNRDAGITVEISDVTSSVDSSVELDGAPYVSGTLITSEGTHVLRVRAEDEAHNVTEVTLSVLIDKSAPKIEFLETEHLLDAGVLQKFRRDIAIELRVTDAVSSATYVATLNGAPYTSETPITAERTHELKVDATDAAGNTATATLRILLDKTPPVIKFSESGTPLDTNVETPFNRVVKVGVEVTDNLPDVIWDVKLDGADYVPGTDIADDGHHIVTVHAEDAAGNQTEAEVRVLVDQAGPLVVIREGARVLDPGIRQLFNHVPTLTIEVTDVLTQPTSTITLDGQPFASGATVAEGQHELKVDARDGVTNQTLVTMRLLVDATAPVVTLSTGGQPLPASGAIFNHDITVAAAVQDISETTVTAKLNGAPFSLSLPIAEERQHTLEVEAVDELAWKGSATATFIVDKTPPQISLFEAAGDVRKPLLHGDSFARAVKLERDVVDITTATITATIDGQAYEFGATYNVNGQHTLVVNGVDQAGNQSETITLTFFIDQNRPEVTLRESGVAYPGDVTFNRNVVFDVTVVAATNTTKTATIDGQAYDLGASYTTEGLHTIVVTVTNVAGLSTNVEAKFTVDKTPPTIQLFADQAPFVNDMKFGADFVLRAEADDNIADPPKTVITLDGQVVPNNGTITEEGVHTVQATATDDANWSATAGPYTFVLDKTPPEVTVKVDGEPLEDGQQFNKAITPVIEADDLTDPVITATLNGSPYTLDSLIEPDAKYTLVVTVKDALNNQTQLEPIHLTIDKTPPVVIVKEGENVFTGGKFARNVTPVLEITDLTETTVVAKLDGNPYTMGQEISFEGHHTLEITVTDELLWSTVVPAIEFTIDKTAPVITVTESGQPLVTGTIFNRDARPKINVTDTTTTTVTATLNGAAFDSETLVTAEQLHKLNVSVVDELHQTTTLPTIEFVVDKTPPQLTLTENGQPLTSGKLLNHDAVPHLTVVDLTAVTITATLDGQPYTLDTPVTQEGQHTLSVSVTDAANWKTELNDVRFFIDKTPPVITINVKPGDEFKTSITPAIDVTDISDTTLVLTLDGQPYTKGTEISAEGVHVLTAVATDALGWQTTAGPISFIIDKTAPRVQVLERGEPLLSGRKFNRDAAPELVIEDLTKTTTVATIDNAPWTSGTPVTSEGTHVLAATVTDNLGQATTIDPISFLIDKTPPVVTIQANGNALVSGSAFTGSVTITIAADDQTQPTVTATLNGAPFTTGNTITDEGAYTLVVSAVDEVGWRTDVPAITFYVDNTPPVVRLVEGERPLSDGQWFNRAVTPDAIITDTTATTSVATLNGAPFTLGTELTNEGAYTLAVKVTDAVGLSTDVGPITFHIDLTPPDITFTTPPAESTVTTPQIVVTGNSDDAVSVEVNGVESSIDAATKTYVTPSFDLLEGPNLITALGIDRAGNNTTLGMTVHLDTRAPQLAITSPAANACISATEVDVRGTLGDATATSVQVSIGEAPAVTATLDGRNWSARLQLPTEGKQTIKVVATDA